MIPFYSSKPPFHTPNTLPALLQPLNTLQPTSLVEKFLYDLASRVVIFTTTGLACTLLTLRNEVDIVGVDKLHRAVLSRPPGTPLVTVANHNSVLDDPGLLSLLLPWEARTNPRRLRWSICTEEICFSKTFPSVWFTLGQAMPVHRGGSIYQKGLASLQEKVNQGHWAQVFAEGRCWQEGGTPLRDASARWCTESGRCGPPGQKLGALKWGVGKLIANASQPPIVLPFFHLGMPDIVPQDSSNSVVTWGLFSGNLISVEVGDPVAMEDLVEAYRAGAKARARRRNEAREGRLKKALGFWSLGMAGGREPGSSSSSSGGGSGSDSQGAASSASSAQPHLTDAEACSLREAALELHTRLAAAEAAAPGASPAAPTSAPSASASPLAALASFQRPTPQPTHWRLPSRDPILDALDTGGDTTITTLRVPQRAHPSGSGVTLSAYNEAPLRIAPPDAEFLSPSEAAEEEAARLALYSAIAGRLQGELAALELRVQARRAARGWQEREPYGVKQRRLKEESAPPAQLS